ncbi:peptidase MA family metallohydrolase [Salinithrix halophila]
MNTNPLGIRWKGFFFFLITFVLLFSFGFSRQGMSIAQPLLHQGNYLLETWRFRDGKTVEGPRSIVYHTSSQERQALLVSKEAEQVLRTFEKRYHFRPEQPVPIFLFSDRRSLSDHFSWNKSQNATGIYFSGSIYLLSPEAWNETFPSAAHAPGKWARLFHERGPLYHEIAHLYLDQTTRGNYPVWYTEAFAQWVEYQELGYEWVIPANRLAGQPLYTFDDLTKRFNQLPNQALAYRQSFLFLRSMAEKHSESSLDNLHTRLSEGAPFSNAWRQVFGESPKESYKQWQHQVK